MSEMIQIPLFFRGRFDGCISLPDDFSPSDLPVLMAAVRMAEIYAGQTETAPPTAIEHDEVPDSLPDAQNGPEIFTNVSVQTAPVLEPPAPPAPAETLDDRVMAVWQNSRGTIDHRVEAILDAMIPGEALVLSRVWPKNPNLRNTIAARARERCDEFSVGQSDLPYKPMQIVRTAPRGSCEAMPDDCPSAPAAAPEPERKPTPTPTPTPTPSPEREWPAEGPELDLAILDTLLTAMPNRRDAVRHMQELFADPGVRSRARELVTLDRRFRKIEHGLGAERVEL